MRLNRYLAQCGLGSRRSCEALITANRVRLNGQPGTLSSQVGEEDHVEVDGKSVRAPTTAPQVWMLHKPVGVVCTASDPEGRRTVVDLARAAGIEVTSLHVIKRAVPNHPRLLAMLMMTESRSATTKQLADRFGLANQTSVRSATRRARVLLASDPAFAQLHKRATTNLDQAA